MRALLTLLIFALVTVARVPAASAQAHTQVAALAFELQGMVAGVSEVKFPHVAASGPNVYAAANINREAATFWAKQDTAAAFGAAESLGIAEGQPDYSTATITTGADGTIYYAWVNQTARAIFLRVKRPGQDWTPAQTVVAGQPFPVFPEIAVTSDGQLFVVWRNPDRPFMYRRSADGGTTWGPIQPLSDAAAVNIADLAVGPRGELAVTYMGGEGDRLQIYMATWNGSGFTKTRVTRLNGDYADPSATFTSDGRLFVSWRGVADAGFASGVFFAERQADGSYLTARLIGGKVQGRVSMESDAAGNLHVIWNAGGKLWYSVKPANGSWAGPVDAPVGSGTIFNAHAAVSAGTGGAIFVHAVSEVFVGSQVSLRYFRFRSGLSVGPALSARPVLEQGATSTRASALALSFTEVSGMPAEVRYRWGSPPTDADPWQPFVAQMTVAAPVLASSHCSAQSLYTQVRAGGVMQTQPLSASIQLDQAVQAEVAPYRAHAAPGYTNRSVMDVRVTAPDECSGLASIRPVISGVEASPISSTPYLLGIELPDEPGLHERGVELTDTLGNTATYSVAVTYDPVAPTATFSELLQIAPSEVATVQQTLKIRGATYSDGEGSEDLPWAVAVAVSRSPINPQARDLAWKVVPLGNLVAWTQDGNGNRTVAADAVINIAELLPRAELTPGVYHYALALVDRAGNHSAAVATGTITLESVTFFRSLLPLLQG